MEIQQNQSGILVDVGNRVICLVFRIKPKLLKKGQIQVIVEVIKRKSSKIGQKIRLIYNEILYQIILTSVVCGRAVDEASTTTIVDDQEAHNNDKCHANEDGAIVKVFPEAKFAVHHFKKAASSAQFV